MPTSVLYGSSSNVSFSALSADRGPRQAAADPSLLQRFPPSRGPVTLILVLLSGVSPCTETINSEHLKSDKDLQQGVSGCHLVSGGERRGRMNELDLFLFHPVPISGSMTEMDEGAAEVSRHCNDVAAING